MKRSWPISR